MLPFFDILSLAQTMSTNCRRFHEISFFGDDNFWAENCARQPAEIPFSFSTVKVNGTNAMLGDFL